MENNKDLQSPTQNQNDNQNLQTDNSKGYGQYIDPDYQKKRRIKLGLLITIIVIAILAIITAVAIFAFSSNSNGGGNTNEAVNVVESCENEECIKRNFSLCQPAVYRISEASDTVEYEIPGIQEIGCLVTLRYIDSEEDEVVGKEMTCDLDNELELQEAVGDALTYPDDYECEGELREYLATNN